MPSKLLKWCGFYAVAGFITVAIIYVRQFFKRKPVPIPAADIKYKPDAPTTAAKSEADKAEALRKKLKGGGYE